MDAGLNGKRLLSVLEVLKGGGGLRGKKNRGEAEAEEQPEEKKKDARESKSRRGSFSLYSLLGLASEQQKRGENAQEIEERTEEDTKLKKMKKKLSIKFVKIKKSTERDNQEQAEEKEDIEEVAKFIRCGEEDAAERKSPIQSPIDRLRKIRQVLKIDTSMDGSRDESSELEARESRTPSSQNSSRSPAEKHVSWAPIHEDIPTFRGDKPAEQLNKDDMDFLAKTFSMAINIQIEVDRVCRGADLLDQRLAAFSSQDLRNELQRYIRKAQKSLYRVVEGIYEMEPGIEEYVKSKDWDETGLALPEEDEEDGENWKQLELKRRACALLEEEEEKQLERSDRLEDEDERLELLFIVEKMQRRNALERKPLNSMDPFESRLRKEGFPSTSFDRAIGCIERFSQWRPFSAEAEECWRLSGVASEKERLLNSKLNEMRGTVSPQSISDLASQRDMFAEELRSSLLAFISTYEVHTSRLTKENFFAVAKQASLRYQQCERVLARLSVYAGPLQQARAGQIGNRGKLHFSLHGFEEIRESCHLTLAKEREWRSRHDPIQREKATDIALEKLRSKRQYIFLGAPNSLEDYECTMRDAFFALRQEESVRNEESDILGEMPLESIFETLRSVTMFYKAVAEEAQRLSNQVENAREILAVIEVNLDPEIFYSKVDSLQHSIFEEDTLVHAQSSIREIVEKQVVEPQQYSLKEREDQLHELGHFREGVVKRICKARSALVSYLWQWRPEFLHRATVDAVDLTILPPVDMYLQGTEPMEVLVRNCLLKSLSMVEGVHLLTSGPLEVRFEVLSTFPSGLVSVKKKQEPAIHSSLPCKNDSRMFLLHKIPLGEDFHGPAVNRLPASTHLTSVIDVWLDRNHLVLVYPHYKFGSLKDWCDRFPPAARKIQEMKGILTDILAGLAVLEDYGVSHGFVTSEGVLIAGNGRAVLAASSPGRNRENESDLLQFVKLVKDLFEGVELSEADTLAMDNLLGMLQKAEDSELFASDVIHHPFFFVDAVGVEVCPICCESVSVEDGIRCDNPEGGHFMCKSCLDGFVKSVSDHDSGGSFKEGDGEIRCFDPCCKSSPLPSHKVAKLISQQSFVEYMTAVSRLVESRTVESMEIDFKAREDKIRDQNLEQLTVERHTTHILNDILTLKCPKGHAFVDFDGCMALTCVTCNSHFCGYCLADCGQDAHPHVRICSSENLYISELEFRQFQNKRRGRMLKVYWDDTVRQTLRDSPDALRSIKNSIRSAIKQLEIEVTLNCD